MVRAHQSLALVGADHTGDHAGQLVGHGQVTVGPANLLAVDLVHTETDRECFLDGGDRAGRLDVLVVRRDLARLQPDRSQPRAHRSHGCRGGREAGLHLRGREEVAVQPALWIRHGACCGFCSGGITQDARYTRRRRWSDGRAVPTLAAGLAHVG